MNLGQISNALGFTLTADFLATLGFTPSANEGVAKLYRASDFRAICDALVAHINAVAWTVSMQEAA